MKIYIFFFIVSLCIGCNSQKAAYREVAVVQSEKVIDYDIVARYELNTD